MSSLCWRQYWFKKTDFESEADTQLDQTDKTEPEKKLFCSFCKHPITDLDQAISINELHTHTFKNPAGYIYTINCFRSAPGCKVVGEATDEYTWFSGYDWQLALCQSCQQQLGWLFSNSNEFFALINDRLTHVP